MNRTRTAWRTQPMARAGAEPRKLPWTAGESGSSIRVSAEGSDAFAGLDADQILAEIERRVADGEEVMVALPVIAESGDALALSSFEPLPLDASIDSPFEQDGASLLEAIAASDWPGDLPVALSDEDNVSLAIQGLDEGERSVFRELLIQYALEDVAS